MGWKDDMVAFCRSDNIDLRQPLQGRHNQYPLCSATMPFYPQDLLRSPRVSKFTKRCTQEVNAYSISGHRLGRDQLVDLVSLEMIWWFP